MLAGIKVLTYRHDETKLLADQLPLVNTANPDVSRMMMHETKATGVEYPGTCQRRGGQ
jgi:hypothetical protein